VAPPDTENRDRGDEGWLDSAERPNVRPIQIRVIHRTRADPRARRRPQHAEPIERPEYGAVGADDIPDVR
jgi:hypothetical protein